ncbi:MAG: DUF4403 family protein [bacterium]|nr:DUF4403 family protein [bacterium]
MRLSGIVLLMAILWLDGIAPANARTPPDEASYVTIPLSIGLDRFQQDLDAVLPQVIDQSEDWVTESNFRYQYKLWKPGLPIEWNGENDLLSLTAEYHYWLKVSSRDKFPFIGYLTTSCGSTSDPRRVLFTLNTPLAWDASWGLVSDATMSSDYINRCKVTFLNIDITGVIDDQFQKEAGDLIAQINQSVEETSREELRPLGERLWVELNKPLVLDDNLTLQINPESVYASPIQFVSGLAQSSITLKAHPLLIAGDAQSTIESGSLPDLLITDPPEPDNIHLPVLIRYDEASRLIGENLTDGTIPLNDQVQIRIESVLLTGQDGVLQISTQLILFDQLGNQAPVKAVLTGVPELSVDDRRISISVMDIQFSSSFPLLQNLLALYKADFIEWAESEMTFDYQSLIDLMQDDGFEVDAGNEFHWRLRFEDITPQSAEALPEGLWLKLTATPSVATIETLPTAIPDWTLF